MSDTLLALRTVPSSKAEQQVMAFQFVQSVLEGEVNPIDAVVQMKSISEVVNSFLKSTDVRDAVIKEYEKYGRGEVVEFKGAKVNIRETGVKYDFANCGDMVWDRLNQQKKELEAAMKEREAYLKVISQKKSEIDEETGEVFEIIPPVKTSTTSYVITFPK